MSRICIRTIIFAICLAAPIATVHTQNNTQPPFAARYYPVDKWKTFTSDYWKFSALMPTKPKEESSVQGSVKNHTFDTFMIQHTFQIDCYESNRESSSLEFAVTNVRNSFLKRGTAKLIRDEKINLGSYEGREMAIAITRSVNDGPTDEMVKSVVQARVFAVGRRVYLVIAKSLNQEAETKEARAFLDSFKLLDSAEVEKPAQSNSKKTVKD